MKTSTLFPSSGPRSYRFVRGLFSRQIEQFEWSLARPKEAQDQTFTDLMKGLRGTVLENAHNLIGVRTLDDFRQAVPIQSYDDVAPLVQRLLAGEKSVLSREKVRGFVETSGTQATPNLIPITRGWSAHIRRAQLLWVIGLLRDFPSISHGDIVHIVSSAAERHTEDGIANRSQYGTNGRGFAERNANDSCCLQFLKCRSRSATLCSFESGFGESGSNVCDSKSFNDCSLC